MPHQDDLHSVGLGLYAKPIIEDGEETYLILNEDDFLFCKVAPGENGWALKEVEPGFLWSDNLLVIAVFMNLLSQRNKGRKVYAAKNR